MTKFNIRLLEIKRLAYEFAEASNDLYEEANKIDDIIDALSTMPSYSEIVDLLIALAKKLRSIARILRLISQALLEIVKEYTETEQDIYNFIKKTEELLRKSNIPNPDIEHGGSSGSFGDDDDEFLKYLITALKQLLLGDFTDDTNLLGTIAQVILGFVPYAGQVADVRDLIADIYKLIDDGPTTQEWVNLGFTLVRIIPGIGDFLKHGDEVSELLKHADCLDELSELVGTGMKKGDEVIGEFSKHIDEIKRLFNESEPVKALEKYSKELFETLPKDTQEGLKKLQKFMENPLIYNNKHTNEEFIKKFIEKTTGIEQMKKDIITNIIDWSKEQIEDYINSMPPMLLSASGFESAVA